VQQEQPGQRPPFVLHVDGDVAPRGEAIGLQIERSEQGPVDLCIRTEDLKYLVSLLLNLGCEAKRRFRQRPTSSALFCSTRSSIFASRDNTSPSDCRR